MKINAINSSPLRRRQGTRCLWEKLTAKISQTSKVVAWRSHNVLLTLFNVLVQLKANSGIQANVENITQYQYTFTHAYIQPLKQSSYRKNGSSWGLTGRLLTQVHPFFSLILRAKKINGLKAQLHMDFISKYRLYRDSIES